MTAADRVMKAADAHKLENPERLIWLPPGEVLSLLPLRPGHIVADIGAGTGYFALPLARIVGAAGRVFAVDLQPEILAFLRAKLVAPQAPLNIEVIHGSADACALPDASCDIVFIANVWHELPDDTTALREFRRILKQNGMLAVVDWRSDTQPPPGPPLDHRIRLADVRTTIANAGWTVEREGNVGTYSYFVLAR